MKKNCFLVLGFLVICVSAVNAQNNQSLTAGQVFSANLSAGAVHTYRIQLGSDPIYHISFEEGTADIVVSVKHFQNEFYQPSIIKRDEDGSFTFRLYDIKNPIFASGSHLGFFRNSTYIIEVQGYESSVTGTYKIVFF
jgi:hypothetical protein